jgi:hypothetical protein
LVYPDSSPQRRSPDKKRSPDWKAPPPVPNGTFGRGGQARTRKNAEKSIKTNKRKYVENAVTKILYWNQKYVD